MTRLGDLRARKEITPEQIEESLRLGAANAWAAHARMTGGNVLAADAKVEVMHRTNEESDHRRDRPRPCDALGSQATCRKRGKPSSWIRRTTRLRVYMRDGFECTYCGAPPDFTTRSLTIDHVVPRSRGGTNKPSNLVTACRACNSARQDSTIREWLMRDRRFFRSPEATRKLIRTFRQRARNATRRVLPRLPSGVLV